MRKYFSFIKLSGILFAVFFFTVGTANAFSLHIPTTIKKFLPKPSPETQKKALAQAESFIEPGQEEPIPKETEPVLQEEKFNRFEDETRQLQDLKRGAQQMSFGLKNFETMINQLEKNKISVPIEIKEKFSRAKNLIEIAKNAKTIEEFQTSGTEELQEIFFDLEQYRVEFAENEMRMRDIRRMLKGIDGPLKQFERQIMALEKKKIVIPAEMKEKLAKIKIIVEAIQNAKNWDEVEAAGVEEIQSLMEDMRETQQQLEYLSRWPQTLQQVDRELKRLEQELKRAKGIVDKLSKKGMDLSGIYTEFETQVNNMKDAREKAKVLMGAGDTEGAFQTLEEEFFAEMDDIWENHQTIMTMSNLGRFASDFKRATTDAQRMIRDLKRKKINTSEIESILAQAKAKGDEILQLMKVKPLDLDEVLSGLQELENLRNWFEDETDQLRGEEETLPWKDGASLFDENIQLPPEWKKIIPKKIETVPQQISPIQETPSIEIIPSVSIPETNTSVFPTL